MIESKLENIVLVFDSRGKVNWSKSLPKNKNESISEWKKRKHYTRTRYSHEQRLKSTEGKEKVYQRSRDWKSKNKERVKSYSKKRYNESRALILWFAAQTRARNSNLNFTLSLSKIEESLKLGKCQATGINFNLNQSRGAFAPSIDRIDGSKGYTDDNCLLVCWCFNTGKNKFSIEDYINVCEQSIQNKNKLLKIYGKI